MITISLLSDWHLGQVDLEGGAKSRLTMHPNETAVLLHNAIHGRQPLFPVPLPDSFVV